MSADRDVAAQFRKGAARRAAGRVDNNTLDGSGPPRDSGAVDVDAILATAANTPLVVVPTPMQRKATDVRSVRSMFITEQAARGMRVLALLRELDHAELVLDAARSCAKQIPTAEKHVSRRRRVRTERLQLKLSPAETAELDHLAEARNMTRSSFVSAVLDHYVASADDRLPGR